MTFYPITLAIGICEIVVGAIALIGLRAPVRWVGLGWMIGGTLSIGLAALIGNIR